MTPFRTLLVVTGLMLASCTSASDTSSTVNEAEEMGEAATPAWRPLFDGATLAGWSNYGKDTVAEGWQVIDGNLTMTGGGGDIVSDDMFGDFELQLEWNVVEGGNSGVFFYVTDGGGAVWQSGIEMQVLDNKKHHDGKNALTSAGACYALYAPVEDVTRTPGEWNDMRLVSKGRHVEHWLNGTLLCEYTIGSDDWNTRVAASKFKDMPDFGKSTSGRFAIQDHGDLVSYRNIRVLDL
ncbi:MAG: hypothetical protein ACI8X5_000481 [Planctomycetota bacterium]|jgi:hypothetical protein